MNGYYIVAVGFLINNEMCNLSGQKSMKIGLSSYIIIIVIYIEVVLTLILMMTTNERISKLFKLDSSNTSKLLS